jgi:hypothetical protein
MPKVSTYNQVKINRFTSGKPMIVRPTCMFCKGTYDLAVDEGQFTAFKNGEYVQEAFSGQSIDFREQLINGSHTDCYDKAFPEE